MYVNAAAEAMTKNLNVVAAERNGISALAAELSPLSVLASELLALSVSAVPYHDDFSISGTAVVFDDGAFVVFDDGTTYAVFDA